MTDRPRVRTQVVAFAVAFLTLLSVTTLVTPAEHAAAYTTKIYRGAGNAPYMGIIGDSTLSGVRWYNTYGDLYEYNFVFDAESCRRTINVSCRGREGYAPENALTVLRRLRGQWGRVLVLMTGYNDPGYQFDEAVDAIVAEARSQGIDKVMWLTMRTADVTYVSPEYRSDSYTFRDNNRILLQKAVQYRGYLQVSDWATYSANRPDWVASDGVHMSYSGGFALMAFVTNQVDSVMAGRTVTPAPAQGAAISWTAVRRGDYGSRVVTVQRALMDKGIEVVGGADGDFGAYTERAVQEFQRSRGLDPSGVVGERTAIALGIYSPPPAAIRNPTCTVSRTLFPGDRLSLVKCLEQRLISRGFRLQLDNRFGSDTVEAVKYFKAVRGGAYNGLVDEWTLRQLGAWKQPTAPTDCKISRVLRSGDKLNEVYCLRKALDSYGFAVGAGYEYVYPAREAVGFLKEKRGMPRDEVVTEEFLRSLGMWKNRPARPPCKVSQLLQLGDRNNAVACLKAHLYAVGYMTGGSREYGPKVELAIRHIETKYGFRVDGVANENVLRRIKVWQEPAASTPAGAPEATEKTAPPTTTAPTTAPTTTTAPTATAPTTTVAPTTTTTNSPSTTAPPTTTTTATTTATTTTTTTTTVAPAADAGSVATVAETSGSGP